MADKKDPVKTVDLTGDKEQNWINDARQRLRQGLPPEGMTLDDVLHGNDGAPMTVREFIEQRRRQDEETRQELEAAGDEDEDE